MEEEEKIQKIKFKYRLEYALVRAFEFCFRITPYRICLWNACILARFVFHIVGWRRKEAIRRIKSVFPDITDKEAARIAYHSIRNILLNCAETMHLSGVSDKWINNHTINCAAAMEKIKAITKDSGAILALPHFGNWDLAGIIVAHHKIPIFSVAGIQHNPLTNDWINNKRATGITILPRGTLAMRSTLKRLKQKEVFAILPDVRMKTHDIEIPFLGSKANLGRGMALFARRTGSPILLAKVWRTDLSHHFLDVSTPIMADQTLDEETDIIRMTTLVMEIIEKQIFENPDQWFWYNKRWVLDPIE